MALVPKKNINSDNDTSSSSEDEISAYHPRIEDDDSSPVPSLPSSMENLSIFSDSEHEE